MRRTRGEAAWCFPFAAVLCAVVLPLEAEDFVEEVLLPDVFVDDFAVEALVEGLGDEL
jgi:hypothetical protein